MNNQPQVFVVDDDASCLKALSRLLDFAGLPNRCFTSAAQFFSELRTDARGCVVTDLDMPGMTGLDLQHRISATPDALPVIFLTGRGDIRSSVRAMRGGAVDFLEKRAPHEDLLNAIHSAMKRDETFHARRMRRRDLRARFVRLTPREREVLQHVVHGKMNKEIAVALGINERTVKLHRTAMTRKLGANSPALLATISQEGRFFEP